MIYGSVCSGIEAATVAWEPLGWRPAWFAEIDPFPSAVLAHHYPEVPNRGDFTEIQHSEPIDILVGGTPCQSFSVAGKRAGLDDPRGVLAFEFLKLAGRLSPTWIVFENVPGLLSSNEGRDFGAFLGSLGELGYGFAYRILDAQFFGVPQRRRRVFVVGYLGDWRPPAAVLFEWSGLSGDFEKGQEPREKVAGRPAACLNSGGNSGGFRTEPVEHLVAHTLRGTGFDASEDGTGRGTPLVASPVTAGYAKGAGVNDGKKGSPQNLILARALNAKGGSGRSDGESETFLQHQDSVRRLTPVECERLQGFPDNYTRIPWRGKPLDRCPDGPRYKSIGNSMAVPVMRWIGERIAMCDSILPGRK